LGNIEKSIVIKAPSEKVWEMLAFDRLPEWSEGFGKKIEYTSEVGSPEEKYRVGATAHGIPKKTKDNYCRFKIIEEQKKKKMKFYAWEKPKFLGTLSMFITYSTVYKGKETKLIYELESDKYGNLGIIGKLLEKLYLRRMVKKQIEKDLEKLKNILENRTSNN